METFELILLLLAVILVSTVISQFMPRVSLPLVQIALGIGVALLSVTPIEFQVDPELFLILFIAPLLFDESRHVNKRDLWDNKGSILSLAIGLVLLTILTIGFVLHWFVPSLPLAAAFALGAALGPTDAVAVSALSKDISISKRQKSLLSGESLINDASGVVSFQFAIAAAVTGTFSITEAGETFIISFLGGIGIGLILGVIALFILRQIRNYGYESTTVHVVFELFIPFIIFFVAEHFATSGILAVVAAGLFITLFPQKLTPVVSRVNIISKSVWEVVVFIINGIIFVLLGMEIPQAFFSEWDADHIFANLDLVGFVFLVTFIIVGVRFIWILGMELVGKNVQKSGELPNGLTAMIQDSLVTTLAGPKGAISLSIAFTIPYTVASGADFPYRNFLIFVASGTILCTLLLANFIVPFLAPKKEGDEQQERRIISTDIEILQNVINELRANQTTETTAATGIVIRNYKERIRELRQQQTSSETLRRIRVEIIEFQEKLVKQSIEAGTVKTNIGEHYLKQITNVKNLLTRSKRSRHLLDALSFWKRSSRLYRNPTEMLAKDEELRVIKIDIETQTIAYLENRLKSDTSGTEKCLATALTEHKGTLIELKSDTHLSDHDDPKDALSHVRDIQGEGLRLELGEIQQMYEDGRLERSEAQALREEVYLMQTNITQV